MKLGSLLVLPAAAALQTTAGMLRLAAGVGRRLAAVVNPAAPSDITWQRKPAGERRPNAAPTTPAPAALRELPDAPAEDLDVAALAARPASAVITALDGLSTVELADLYDHEFRNRRRAEVLAAVEAAAAPPAQARGEGELPADDVREPDELVYSTQTPPRP